MDDHPSIIPPPPEGTISQDDFDAYLAVTRDALLIHYDRERVRRALWKDYTAKDQANSIKIKIDRVVRSFDILEGADETTRDVLLAAIREEFLDIINYANFGVRQLS